MDYAKAFNLLTHIGRNSQFISGEENTKKVLIEPVLEKLWGYSVPEDITLEYVADVGVKAGEKVDYAIKIGGQVKILVEAKDIHEEADAEYISQLYRYFAVTGAELGILTNGVEWRFYTDTQRKNIMDTQPFFVVNLMNYTAMEHEIFSKMEKGIYDISLMKKLCGIREFEKQRAIDEEYQAIQRIKAYMDSEQYYTDIMFRCNLGLYDIAKVRELVQSVQSGSYILKYAKMEHSGESKRISIIEANADTLSEKIVTNVVFVRVSEKVEIGVNGWFDIPSAIAKFGWRSSAGMCYEAVMEKFMVRKNWIKKHNDSTTIEIGMTDVYGYDIAQPKTIAEAIKRSMQLLKAFKIEPSMVLIEVK